MRLRVRLAIGVGVLAVAVGGVTVAVARDGRDFNERLKGFQEVPANSTTGKGKIQVGVRGANGGSSLDYKLSYAQLEAPVQQAHIHLGQRSVNGGIVVFLCSNLGNGPAGTPACPASPGTVEGTLDAADVVGPAAQGIAPGEFAEFTRALRAGVTYANVHTDKFPNGEIRGQLGDDDNGHGKGKKRGHR
jgi:hypothetical protein